MTQINTNQSLDAWRVAYNELDSDFRNGAAAIQVVNNGGFGSLAYNSSTGFLTFTGTSVTDVRDIFSAGTGILYDSSSGQFSATAVTPDVATTAANGIASFDSADFDVNLGLVTLKAAGIQEEAIADDAITSDKLSSVVELKILNSAGNEIKTLFGAGT